MNKKRVGILTFHNGSNYGAALQTFALQEALKKAGYSVEIINYKNDFIMKGLNTYRFEISLHGLYYLFTDVINHKDNKKKIKRFRNFFELYSLSELLSRDKLKNVDLKYDVVVSGSDQIWNPTLNNGFDDIYFGEIFNVKKRVSYASSLGNYKFNNAALNLELCNYLKRFEHISVREHSDTLEEIAGRPINKVCDPTILLTMKEWAEKLDLKSNDIKYLLVYCLSDAHNVIEYAKKLANERGLKVFYIGKPLKNRSELNCFNDLGPKEFVELFYNATYIVTNSFHGTAFAVNFSKQFVSLIHPKSPERAKSFLHSVDLDNRLIGYTDRIKDMSDMEKANALDKLNTIRKESYDYIHVSI